MDGANDRVEIANTAAALRHGVSSISDSVVGQIGAGLPADEYLITLLEVTPTLVRLGSAADYFHHEQIELWGLNGVGALPHHPKVSYYRGGENKIGNRAKLFEFVVPMFPDNWLDKGITEQYSETPQGEYPTAVALAVLDIKGLYDFDSERDIDEHWCLAHYVLDGHHKLLAAAETSRSVRLLSFVSVSKGIATREQIAGILSSLT